MASSRGSDGAPNGEDLQPSSSRSSSSTDSSITMSSNVSREPISLTIRVLQEITDNFSEDRAVGQGAYGKVYKGVREDGEEIAVKLLYNNLQAIDDKQFQREFYNLMMLNHQNIIRLVGYCYETQRQHMCFQGRIVFGETTYRALCFQYMHMGSLQRHLSDESSGLDWQTRYKIIKGTCEGLKYLHEGFIEPIYHLDLKPDNILLDENMVPKLADFGLSKFFGEEQTRITQSVTGTIGYMPPEYLFRNVISKKLDIFSLGVVMTQIIAGPKGHTRSDEMPLQEFLDQVHQNWMNRLEEMPLSQPLLRAYCEQVSICTKIGVTCMEFDREKRPSILNIINRLDETECVIEKTYMQSASLGMEEQRVKSRDTNQWMPYRLLPENPKEQIRRYQQYRWQEASGVDEENLQVNLPKDLRIDIKRHLCLSLLMRVPLFKNLDNQFVNALCDHLKPVSYTEGGYIVREGDPVNQMLFIMRGDLISMTKDGKKPFYDVLKGGDFCGEELVTWAIDLNSTYTVPSSTRTMKAMSEVEGFALISEDFKFVAIQFRHLQNKIQNTFRFCSQQWRTWAACFIQAAWHRHCRRKLQDEDSLREKVEAACFIQAAWHRRCRKKLEDSLREKVERLQL